MNRLFAPPKKSSVNRTRVDQGVLTAPRGHSTYSLLAPMHYEPNYAYPVVVWLHSDGGDEKQLLRVMPHVSMRNYVGVGVRGSNPCEGRRGFQWQQSASGILTAENRVLEAIVAAKAKFNVNSERIFLAGHETSASALAWALYAFNLFSIGPLVVLFFANLMIMGWWVALAVVSLILRHGAGAEALAWSVLFGLTPFSAVFYPVSILPVWVQPVALALPSAHVFEGMRQVLADGTINWGHMGAATGLNAVWMGVAILIFARQFRAARERGALLSIGE